MKVFLSHTSADKPFVERLRDDLTNAGVDVWTHERIPAGGSFVAEIMRQLRESDVVVLVLSDAAARSPNLQSEVAIAIANQMRGAKTWILPVLASPKAEIPFFVRDLVCLDLSTPEAYATNIMTLVDRVTAPSESDLSEPASRRAKEEYAEVARSALQVEKAVFRLESERRTTRLCWLMASASSMLTVIAVSVSLLAALGNRGYVVAGVGASLFAAITAYTLSLSAARRARRQHDDTLASIQCKLKETLSSEERPSRGGPER